MVKKGGGSLTKRHSISKRGIKRTEREKKIFYEMLAALRGVVNWVGMMPDADAPATIAAKPQAFERGHLTTEAGLRSAAYGRGADSSRSTVQLFDYKDRLYQIEAKALRSPCRCGPFSSIADLHRRRFKPL
jgi:hypothetical protein